MELYYWVDHPMNPTISEAPKIAKLVYNSNVTMVYGTYNELVTGAYKPTKITGGAPHCNY